MAKSFWSVPLPEGAGLILARPDLPSLFILNPSAAFLWSLYQRHPVAADLVQPFASHYGIPLTQAHADITATLHSWSQTLLADPPTPVVTRAETSRARKQAVHFLDFSLGPMHFSLFIDPNAPDFLDEIRPRLAHLVSSKNPSLSGVPLHVTRSPHEPALRVFANHQLCGTAADAAQARLLLLPEIARLASPHPDAPWFAILHAAALAHPTSHHAVILPAPTGSGKSTLTTALLHHAHLRLLSDDSAALTSPHELLSLPFALMLRSGSWPLFPDLINTDTPTHLRYGSDLVCFLPPPTPIDNHTAIPKHLVFVNYQPDSVLRWDPLDPLQTFLHLQKAGFWVPHTQPAITAFVSWVTSLPSYQLTYSHLPTAVQAIKQLFNKESFFHSPPL